jgi:hypothetical protein
MIAGTILQHDEGGRLGFANAPNPPFQRHRFRWRFFQFRDQLARHVMLLLE